MIRLSRAFDFQGAFGHRLSGRLDLPAGTPLATVLFAHCFTCGKDHHSSARIARRMAERGFAVLRFDFTGLGNSSGDFANTSFSSNVADLLAAARALGSAIAPPKLLVGHSLGGAAVIRAAVELPDVTAVATIAAPFDPAHIGRLIAGREAEIETLGRTQVTIGGRSFPITRAFLEDIHGHRMKAAIEELGRPLLILHDPDDSVVGVENAELILAAARHPKSFLSIPGAGHLVARREDAQYVADSIAAWALRTLGRQPTEHMRIPVAEADRSIVTVTETGEGGYGNLIDAGGHLLTADEPHDVGGGDTGPNPYQLLLAALGACTSMTMRMYANRKGWAVGRISVVLTHAKVDARPGTRSAAGGNKIDRITRRIALENVNDPDIKGRLLEIAERCPIHRTLHGVPEIVTTLDDQSGTAPHVVG